MVVGLSVLLPVLCADVATGEPRDLNRVLNGEYAFTGHGGCLISPAGFSPNLAPLGPAFLQSFSMDGTRIYHGDGTGISRSRVMVVNNAPPPGFPPVAGLDITCAFVYTTSADLTVTMNNSCSGTVVAGPAAGQAVQILGNDFKGRVSEDRKTHVLTIDGIVLETFVIVLPDGAVRNFPQVCHRSQVEVSVDDEVETDHSGR
jgi:hypothetical protein